MKNTTKSRIQGFVAGLVVCSILMFNSAGFAAGIAKSISVIFNSATVRIDGQVLAGDNINYNNNIYVSLEKVSELLGKTFNWDKKNNTIDVTTKTQVETTVPATGGNSGTGQKVEEIVVKSVDEFIKAIGSNRKIVLKPGVYNLSKVANRHTENKNIAWVEVNDGVQLRIINVSNLTIIGEGVVPAEIVAEPRFAEVLEFMDCQYITLNNLKVGHTVTIEEYDCNAGVLFFNNCKNINIDKCTLYGCGSMGITAYYTSSLKMENSIIEKCNLRIMSLAVCKDFTFTNCKFRESTHLDMFNLFYSDNIIFNGCEIRDNISDYCTLFDITESNNIKVLNSRIINNKAAGIGYGLDLTGTVFQWNNFDKK